MLAKLGHGPWNTVFEGKWSNHDIVLLENPEKLTVTMITDIAAKKIKGYVLIFNKYFVIEGEVDGLFQKMQTNVNLIWKDDAGFKAKYLIISAGPYYSKPEEVNDQLEQALESLEQQTEQVNIYSAEHKLQITELRNAAKYYYEKLFSDPLLLPSVISKHESIAAERPTEPSVIDNMLLGIKPTGETVTESIKSISTITIIGNPEQQANASKVIAENCVSNRINTIVFDENRWFEKTSTPNSIGDFSGYENLQPVGMPVKNVKLNDVRVNLNLLDFDTIKEVLNIGGREGSAALEIIGNTLNAKKGSINWLEDLENAIEEQITDNKFQNYRAIRILKVFNMIFPELLDGKSDVNALVSGQLRGMGIIARLDLSNIPEPLCHALIYSILESLAEQKQSVMCVFQKAEKIIPPTSSTVLQKKVFESIEKASKTGIRMCFAASHEIDINQEVRASSSLEMQFINKDEAAVKVIGKKPYRMKIRPSLSS